MAEVSDKVIKKAFKDKLMSITEFRNTKAQGVSSQAINYAIENDKIDYIKVNNKVRIIVLTKKTLAYKPNASKKRAAIMSL